MRSGEVLKPLVEPKTPSSRRGRPWADTRSVLEGVLWIYGPEPNGRSCRVRSFHHTRRAIADSSNGCAKGRCRGTARDGEDLPARGQLDLARPSIDATFAGEKGAVQLVQHAAAKAPTSWQLRSAMVFLSPPGLSASPHETRFVEATVAQRFTAAAPSESSAIAPMTAIRWMSGCNSNTVSS